MKQPSKTWVLLLGWKSSGDPVPALLGSLLSPRDPVQVGVLGAPSSARDTLVHRLFPCQVLQAEAVVNCPVEFCSLFSSFCKVFHAEIASGCPAAGIACSKDQANP